MNIISVTSCLVIYGVWVILISSIDWAAGHVRTFSLRTPSGQDNSGDIFPDTPRTNWLRTLPGQIHSGHSSDRTDPDTPWPPPNLNIILHNLKKFSRYLRFPNNILILPDITTQCCDSKVKSLKCQTFGACARLFVRLFFQVY